MTNHQQQPETSQPGSQDGSRPGTSVVPEDEALVKAQRDFPGHRIWREILPGRTVYIARSHYLCTRLHTVVPPDLPELLEALNEAAGVSRPR